VTADAVTPLGVATEGKVSDIGEAVNAHEAADIDRAIDQGKRDAEQARAARTARAAHRTNKSSWAIAGGTGAIPLLPGRSTGDGPSRAKTAAKGAGKRVSAATRAGIWHWTRKKRTTTRTVWRFLLFGASGRPQGLQLSHAQRVAYGKASIKKRRRAKNGRLI
jgi:hypothetical protein